MFRPWNGKVSRDGVRVEDVRCTTWWCHERQKSKVKRHYSCSHNENEARWRFLSSGAWDGLPNDLKWRGLIVWGVLFVLRYSLRLLRSVLLWFVDCACISSALNCASHLISSHLISSHLISSHLISSSRSSPKRNAKFPTKVWTRIALRTSTWGCVWGQSTERQSESNATENKMQQEYRK